MKRAIWLALAFLPSCRAPADALYDEAPSRPQEIAPGIFRLTQNPGGDYPRGLGAAGHLLYRADSLVGIAPGAALVEIDPESGRVEDVAAVYRRAFPGEEPAQLVVGPARRVLLMLQPPVPRSHWCGDATLMAPAPPYSGWHVVVLPPGDDQPVSSLLAVVRELPLFMGAGRDSVGGLFTNKRIRIAPALAEADSLGTNPWGPVVSPDGAAAYLSDAEVIWRYDLTDPSPAPMPVAPGAYPVLSADGESLFLARPLIVDSVESVTTVPWSMFVSCTQRIVRYVIDDWMLVRRHLASGVEDTLGPGSQPVLLGDTALVIRRRDGLHVLSLVGGASRMVTPDSSATSPVIDSAGEHVMYSSRILGNPEILRQRLR